VPPVIDKACTLKRKIICTQLLCQASGPASLVRGWLAFTTMCLGNSVRLPHALAPAGHMRSSDVVIDHRWLLHRMCCVFAGFCMADDRRAVGWRSAGRWSPLIPYKIQGTSRGPSRVSAKLNSGQNPAFWIGISSKQEKGMTTTCYLARSWGDIK
jgi:hypothetical protein